MIEARPESTDPREYKIPIALLAIGILIYLFFYLLITGSHGFTTLLISFPLQLVIQMVMGIIVCVVTAKIFGTSFGNHGSALLKLAAIFTFSGAVAVSIPFGMDWMVFLLVCTVLLKWLFQIDTVETIVFVILLAATKFVALLVLVMIFGSP